ncbi:MAG: hypothetical protein WAV13_05630 [Thermodesulfovibrionales bacterium]
MRSEDICIPGRAFRNLFIVQNRNYWKSCPYEYDPAKDLVLTFDFGVFREVTENGGTVAYLDHLVRSEVMENYNYKTYDFFAKWYYDKDGKDIFFYKDIGLGNAFMLSIWNDVTYFVSIALSIMSFKLIQYESLYAGISDSFVLDMLLRLGIKFESWPVRSDFAFYEYYFPIFDWMDQKIRPKGLMQRLKAIARRLLSGLLSMADTLKCFGKTPIDIYVLPYYPTRKIMKRLQNDGRFNVITEGFSGLQGLTKTRILPVHGSPSSYSDMAGQMVSRFHAQKTLQWSVEGMDMADALYGIILKRVSVILPECLLTIDSIYSYFAKRDLRLMVTISNIGIINCLMLNYCHKRNIPTYLIINGYLGSAFLDESKDAQWINSYGTSIKEHYFAGMENIVCLGDPRIDDYARSGHPRNINRDDPTIIVGASGYSNIDLNSYVAVEFAFLNDILAACRTLIGQGRRMNVIVKVRANGYIKQYSRFLQEYYYDIPVTLYDQKPMKQILSQADFYISIYSGTLFEASSLGVPVLYYKKDTEISDPPFDGKSELVTALTPDDLIRKIELFYERDHIFDAFMDKKVLEKYVGPPDGKNVERNMDFIYSLLNTSQDAEEKKQ